MKKIFALFILIVVFFVVILCIVMRNGDKAEVQNFSIDSACDGKPCNVIFIVADTLGAKHMGIYDYKYDTTPFINSYFSEQSLVYTNAYSTASWTLPSFASFMRSQYPSEIDIRSLANGEDSLPKFLREAGIKVLATGDAKTKTPMLIFESITNLFQDTEFLSSSTPTTTKDDGGALEKASKWLLGSAIPAEGQFLLFIHDWTVHDPYDAPKEYSTLFDSSGVPVEATLEELIAGIEKSHSDEELVQLRKQYDQEVRFFDDKFKTFIETMPESVKRSTIVIVMADHGEGFGEHGLYFHANSIYDELTHVPLLVKIPGVEQSVITAPVSLIDITPTILSWMDVPYPNAQFLGKPLITKDDRSDPRALVRSEFGVFPLMEKIPTMSFNSHILKEAIPNEILEQKIFAPLTSVSLRDSGHDVIVSNEKNGEQNIEVYDYHKDINEQEDIYDPADHRFDWIIDTAAALLKKGSQ